jgi:hypothetical protein
VSIFEYIFNIDLELIRKGSIVAKQKIFVLIKLKFITADGAVLYLNVSNLWRCGHTNYQSRKSCADLVNDQFRYRSLPCINPKIINMCNIIYALPLSKFDFIKQARRIQHPRHQLLTD